MGGSDQPYIYPNCAPLSERRIAYPYSNFNPRASTQAAYQAIQDQNRPKPKQDGPLLKFDQPANSYLVTSGDNVNYTPAAYEALQAKKRTKPEGNGPLINFNQHPDSWMVVAEHKPKYTPMPANTKTKVTVIRWVQFVLRVFNELGALGLLVCLICFKNMPGVFSWIMRIAVAWDVVITLYAIYHLARPARGRTPVSSASYHTFALLTDVALLPFHIVLCLNAHNNYLEGPGTKDSWKSLIKDPQITTDLIFATYIAAWAVAGLHFLCAALDLWLIVLFKQIANLPPDANPLEDNLTSRASIRRSKHKYKNSEATLTDSASEKHQGYLSGSTLSVDRNSYASTAEKELPDPEPRKIPFSHSRMRSEANFSPHNPNTARQSRQQFEEVPLHKPSSPAPASRNGAASPSVASSRGLSRQDLSPNPSAVAPWRTPQSASYPRLNSPSPAQKGTAVTDFARQPSPALPNAAPSQSLVRAQQTTSLMNNNWYSIGEDDSPPDTPSRQRTPAPPAPMEKQLPLARREVFQPLKMNPPTPPPKDEEYPDPGETEQTSLPLIKRSPLANRADNGNGELSRHLTVQSTMTGSSSVYSDDDDTSGVNGGTPKRKYYGDLAAATRGVLGFKSKDTSTAARILSNETVKSTGTIDASTFDATGFSALSDYGYGNTSRKQKDQYIYRDKNGRVVSRTGVDIVDLADSREGFGMRGRRDVSGKIAEEGRGGGWFGRKMY